MKTAKGQGVGSGRLQKQIVLQLHGSSYRYTPSALSRTMGVNPNSMANALNGLLEIGVVKADKWRDGYCYRAPHVPNDAAVAEVKMTPQIVMTTP